MHTICFGTKQEHIQIVLPSEIRTQNWAKVQIRLSVEGFTGDVPAFFDKDDFVIFARQLNELNASLTGKATLEPLDRQFSLRLSADVRGHIRAEGELWSRASCGNKLAYAFEFDQTYLREPLAQLQEAVGVWAEE